MSTEVVPITPDTMKDLMVHREPTVVLSEAQRAAAALRDVVAKKAKPVIFNGEQYLEYEDWLMMGKFYGVTTKVVETKYVEFTSANVNVNGYEAKAVVIRLSDGVEVSGAEAMCMNDEPTWHKKPLFQLRSMAQTRACAKALRNVLAWVVVLAGYRPTPAEEMDSGRPAFSPKPVINGQIQDWKEMPSKFPGKCRKCATTIKVGDTIFYNKLQGSMCEKCNPLIEAAAPKDVNAELDDAAFTQP